MRRLLSALAAAALIVGWPIAAHAHGLGLARLELRDLGGGQVLARLHAGTGAGRDPGLEVLLPAGCHDDAPRQVHSTDEGVLIVWTARCPGDELVGQVGVAWRDLAVPVDVLLQLERRDGTRVSTLLTPGHPTMSASASGGGAGPLARYFTLGAQHVLGGWDHLAFLLGLLLLARGLRRTVATVTAFTLGHSLTLSLAALRLVHVPAPPVEAVIALSVLLLAVELTRRSPGLIAGRPWLVAGGFGLLHGLGFAGGLTAYGLPEREIAWALAGFNLGVEAGQLAVVSVALALAHLGRRLPIAARRGGERALTYALGSLACFWLCERIAGFFPGGLS